MLSENDMVVCGLSGGADSVALLLALYELKEKLDITVESVHVNHCLRGAESDRDEMFCRELCKRLGITFQAVSCDVKGLSVSENISTEEAARKLRYKIFEEHSKGKKLATAQILGYCKSIFKREIQRRLALDEIDNAVRRHPAIILGYIREDAVADAAQKAIKHFKMSGAKAKTVGAE